MNDFNLDWLLFPYAKEKFATDFFEKNYLHIQRNDRFYFEKLLQAHDLDALLGSRQFQFPSLRLTKAGEELTSEKYSNDKQVDLSRVHKFFLDGYTIILNALHEQNKALGTLVNRLSNDLGHPFQTNIYITPPNSQGFPAHYDTHDVFVLQIEGSKSWRIYADSPVVLPTKQMEFQKEKHAVPESYTMVELKKGELLYIPRGMMHDAQTNSDLSVHVTLGWLGYTWTDVLIQMLLEFSKNKDAPRRFIDPFKDTASQNLEQEFSNVLHQFLSSNAINQSLQQFRLELAANQRFFFDDLLKNATQYQTISPISRFLLRKNVSSVLKNSSDEVSVIIGSRAITFPHYTFNAIDFIINSTQPFTVSNLPDDLDDEGKMVLVKRLLKEGVLTLI
jgi:hypothetical protein